MRVFLARSLPDLSFITICPGDWVVLKPNLIKESKENDRDEWRSVVTSPDIIRSLCEYVCIHLQGRGKVTICDAPQTDSSFREISQRLGLLEIATQYSRKYNVAVEVIDLRNEEWTNEKGVITRRAKLGGDPNGNIRFDLGKESLFYGYKGEGRYYGADYDAGVVNSHHQNETHEYLVSATPILADVFINLPKLKTHKKTGVTLSLKNLVGINADKNWLPHHTEGSPENGGDQFPDLGLFRKLEQIAVKMARRIALLWPLIGPEIAQKMREAGGAVFGKGDRVIRSGNWYGNDTTWRMVVDLNRCLLYGNPDGTLRKDHPKRYYTIIDGTVGMDGLGPMQGNPVKSNVILGGSDPVAVDAVAARVMGFDWRKIPTIREAFTLATLPVTTVRPEEIFVVSDVPEWQGKFLDFEDRDFLHFEPHFGWKGHIEYSRNRG